MTSTVEPSTGPAHLGADDPRRAPRPTAPDELGRTPQAADAAGEGSGASLALCALVLGIAGTVLGVTIVWFFAAIPLGIAACVTGWLALRRPQTDRHRTRAVLGAVLGLVALLLGIMGAVFLPPIVHRADRALTNAETDVNANISHVDGSLTRDVNRLDATMTRNLDRLDRRNHDDLLQFEGATGKTLDLLEQRIASTATTLTVQERADLAALETQLRGDLDTLEQSLRGADTALHTELSALESRVKALEVKAGS